MIKEIFEENFEPFYDLIAEIEFGNYYNPNDPSHVTWIKKRISSHFLRGARFFALYVDDDTPAGISAVLIEKMPEGIPCISKKSELLGIVVFPRYRCKGYASQLMKHAEEHSLSCGVYCMYVSTYAARHKTKAFYRSKGYIPVATLPDVNGPDDVGSIYMRKILQ